MYCLAFGLSFVFEGFMCIQNVVNFRFLGEQREIFIWLLYTSLSLGLWVDMYGSDLKWGEVLCFAVFSVFLSKFLACLIPQSISGVGTNVLWVLFWSLTGEVPEWLYQIQFYRFFLVKLNEIFILACLGWHELKTRYCFVSVALWYMSVAI